MTKQHFVSRLFYADAPTINKLDKENHKYVKTLIRVYVYYLDFCSSLPEMEYKPEYTGDEAVNKVLNNVIIPDLHIIKSKG